jgi:hypothetical protein
MSKISLFISSLKDSIKDFVTGQELIEEEGEHPDDECFQDGLRDVSGGGDDGAPGMTSASDEEVVAFASYLGIDADHHKDLLWVAREALVSPLPLGWKECVGQGGAVFFVQKDTNIVQWEHPLDEYYKSLARKLIQEKQSSLKRLVSIAEETLTASAPFFSRAEPRDARGGEELPPTRPASVPDIILLDQKRHTLASLSNIASADAEAAAAAAVSAISQAAEAAAIRNVAKFEAEAEASDVRAAECHHRSLASAAAYAADKVGDPTRDRRRKVLQFMQFLGMSVHDDQHLLWIAEEAANAPLPPDWEVLENDFGEEYFYNRRTEHCRTTHPLEEHYKAVYRRHKYPEAPQAAASCDMLQTPALLAKADAVLPPALRAALDYATPLQMEPAIIVGGVGLRAAASPAKSMMSMAAASGDGVAAYWGGYAICGCIKSINVSNSHGKEQSAARTDTAGLDTSLFPEAVAPAHVASSHLKISARICSECHVIPYSFDL